MLIHEELKNLQMTACTLCSASRQRLLAKLKEGAKVEFVAERVEGKLTATDVEN